MNFIKINLANGHFIGGIFKTIFEQIKITLEHLINQMHRQIVEIILHGMRAFGAVPFAFVDFGMVFKSTLLGVSMASKTVCIPALNFSVQKM